MTEPVAVAVLAKAPVAGLAKTRLIPALGAAGAARLQRRLTLRTLHTAQAAAIGPVTLWCAPDVQHRFFRALAHTRGLACRPQAEGDIGQRMAAAFEAHAQAAPTVPLVLLGTDCPALTPTLLQATAQALRDGTPAVVVPAEDGGYVLIGLRQPQPALFAGVDWGTDRVMAQTRDRLAALGLAAWEPATLWDLDRPADLAQLATLADWP